ncbi:hypothetical protein [Neobacillus vireti]|uniref:hypothetical protein n=1 Tax=Neobacillus vireti TaxID=220686 RepID=UPI00300026B4
MVTIKVTAEWKDALSDIQSIVLKSITSNELPDGSGDGHTAQDIQNAAYGKADFEFDLRAEPATPEMCQQPWQWLMTSQNIKR